MARIRSIKPEFFDHEELCELGPWHRLCFAGLWTQADKAGRMEDRPRRLKAKIFPYDDLDFESLLRDLAVAGFIIRYVVDDQRFICIPEDSWAEHQRPRKDEHESLLPSVTCAVETYSTLNSDESVTTECVGSRKVGSREVGSRTLVDVGADAPPPPEHSRAEDLQALWNDLTKPPIPRCRELSAKRRKQIAVRLREHPLEWWAEVITRAQASTFLRGESGKWCITFDWLIENAHNAVKVADGNYDDRQTTTTPPAVTSAEFSKAEQFRKMAWGRCRHDPKCEDYAECVTAIALHMRHGAQGAA